MSKAISRRTATMLMGTAAVTGMLALSGCLSDDTPQPQEAAPVTMQGIDEGLPVRETVNDYSWAELAALGDMLSAAGGKAQALELAKTYHLVGDDYRLDGSQVKWMLLADGVRTGACVCGIYHDELADGGGFAGLTFMFTDAIAYREMNPANDNTSGWEGCELRGWLAGDGMASLPADLAPLLVPVRKMTLNTVTTGSMGPDYVTPTVDRLWLFSARELTGTDDTLYEFEGQRYQLFEDLGDAVADETVLSKSHNGDHCSWWMRSPWWHGQVVEAFRTRDGAGGAASPAAYAEGVVPGFSLGGPTEWSGVLPQEQDEPQAGELPLDSYSWDELARIADEISAAPDATEAWDIALSYGLCTPQRTLDGTQAKSVTLADGTQTAVVICGFYHDDKADEQGSAGITFMFRDSIGWYAYNVGEVNTRTNEGGWEQSDVRFWMQQADDGVWWLLPEDLRAVITPVYKLTNNVGRSDEDVATPTRDTVWLFAESEVEPYFGSKFSYADGYLYDLFTVDIATLSPTAEDVKMVHERYLSKTDQGEVCSWHLRCPDRNTVAFSKYVTGLGQTDSDGVTVMRGIVPGFCL